VVRAFSSAVTPTRCLARLGTACARLRVGEALLGDSGLASAGQREPGRCYGLSRAECLQGGVLCLGSRRALDPAMPRIPPCHHQREVQAECLI